MRRQGRGGRGERERREGEERGRGEGEERGRTSREDIPETTVPSSSKINIANPGGKGKKMRKVKVKIEKGGREGERTSKHFSKMLHNSGDFFCISNDFQQIPISNKVKTRESLKKKNNNKIKN